MSSHPESYRSTPPPAQSQPLSLEAYLENQKQRIEAYILSSIEEATQVPLLLESMRYSLEAGGKRLRPILTVAAYECLAPASDVILPIAAALECIHTYSLIHDDLPAMDDDDLRRGKPTNHKVYGEANAILAGDALLSEAFVYLAAADAIPADRRLKVIEHVARAAGGRGMVGGQLLDMEHEAKEPTLASLKEIHTLKTGRLLTAAVEAGAIAAGADQTQLQALSAFGYHLGYAFQIVDDVLDVTGGAAIGKSPNSDERRGKATFVAMLGIDASRQQADDEIAAARQALEPFGSRAAILHELAGYVLQRDN